MQIDGKVDNILDRLKKGDECLDNHEGRLKAIEDTHKADAAKGGLLSRLSSGTVSFILVCCAVGALLLDLFWRR
jgi:hypothetical protein